MKKSAILINVGRGKLVNTDDLVEALRTGEIAGAGLEVVDPEPLPDDHPLWGMKNCTMTPHMGASWQSLLVLLTITPVRCPGRADRSPLAPDAPRHASRDALHLTP